MLEAGEIAVGFFLFSWYCALNICCDITDTYIRQKELVKPVQLLPLVKVPYSSLE